MYLSDYRTQVRNALDVSSTDDHFTDAYLNYCIQTEVRTLATDMGRYESEYVTNIKTVDLSVATNYADSFDGIKVYLTSGFNGIVNIRYQATTASTPEPVMVVSAVEFDAIMYEGSALYRTNCDWVASVTGDPTGIKIQLFPDPNGVGYLILRYKFIPATMSTDTSTSGLPASLDDLIVLGAASRASVKSIEPDRISKLQTDYLTLRQRILPAMGEIGGSRGIL